MQPTSPVWMDHLCAVFFCRWSEDTTRREIYLHTTERTDRGALRATIEAYRNVAQLFVLVGQDGSREPLTDQTLTRPTF